MKRQAIDTHIQRIFAKDIFGKGPVSRKYKNSQELTPILLKLFQKSQRKELSQVHSMRPQSSRHQSEATTSHTHTHTHTLQAYITDEHKCKNHQQNTSKLNPTIH